MTMEQWVHTEMENRTPPWGRWQGVVLGLTSSILAVAAFFVAGTLALATLALKDSSILYLAVAICLPLLIGCRLAYKRAGSIYDEDRRAWQRELETEYKALSDEGHQYG